MLSDNVVWPGSVRVPQLLTHYSWIPILLRSPQAGDERWGVPIFCKVKEKGYMAHEMKVNQDFT